MKLLNPKFEHQKVEAGKYAQWLEKDVFYADVNSEKKPFTIVLPPPNVTGKLHIGHAWDVTLQDILVRYKKMNGYEAVLLPSMDHAGIATQAKVAERLREQGINSSQLGREGFLKEAWNWKDEYAQTIREQWAKLGLSLDYSKEKFTLDEEVNESVTKVFVDLYNKGLIYQGYRITNWDPVAQTALSDIEVLHKDVDGYEYYFKYVSVDNPNDFLTVMTTRPETIFGDSALAVNGSDERYTHLIGKKYFVPNTDIQIPVIADDYVDMEKGSGVVKITKAHDPNDYEVAMRHNLEARIVMNLDGTMAANEWVLPQFHNVDRFEVRKQLIELSIANGVFLEKKDLKHSVGHSERTGAVVEPLLSKQWYVKMDELAKRAIANQKTEDKVTFYPNRFENVFNQWMENIQDWCISRQLWWGHRIPVWYRGEEIYVGATAPVGDGWVQDEDVLDTWFSSALWPFVMTNWQDEDQTMFNKFFPADVLVTGYDIIFFWVSRMIFQSLEFTGKRPFTDVLIHGLVRDENGKKMSKSLGNGVDPMEVIEQYGADSVRYALIGNNSPGQDIRYSEKKLEAAWNFINKVWNISRYVLMNTEDIDLNVDTIDQYQHLLNNSDKYIISKFNIMLANTAYNFDKYELAEVQKGLYDFIWEDFANWYVETTKVSLREDDAESQKKTRVVLKTLLANIIKMLHPFTPFVTEEIYAQIDEVKSIYLTSWPTKIDIEEQLGFGQTIEIITQIRNIKAENDVKPSELVTIALENLKLDSYDELVVKTMAKVKAVEYLTTEPTAEVFTRVLMSGNLHVYSEGLIDIEAKITDLKQQMGKLEGEIARSYKMLSNDNFVSRAPEQKLQIECDKANQYISNLNDIYDLLRGYDVEVVVNDDIELLTTKVTDLLK